MKVQSVNQKILNNQNTSHKTVAQKQVSFGVNLVKFAKEVPCVKNKKIIVHLKEFMFGLLKKSVSISKNRNLKVVDQPVIVPVLQRPEDFAKKTAETILKNSAYGTSVNSHYPENYKILCELKSKGISIPDMPWDAPITDSGILTDTAYETIIKNIKNSNLDDYKKEELIKKLKAINFKGHEESFTGLQITEHTDITDLVDVDHDVSTITDYFDVLHEHIVEFGEHIWDGIKEFFDPAHLG